MNLQSKVASVADNIAKVPSAADSGFQWPYYLYVPNTVERKGTDGERVHLLVLPLNTGQPDDDMSVFDKGAFRKIRQYQDIADHLEVALLVPVFPRPKKHACVYTHALDRDTLLTAIQGLQRLDKQLLAMIDDAMSRWSQGGWNVESKVLMVGFSASGMFANRFAILHPKRVLAAAIGSPGGWPIAPIGTWKGRRLRYPDSQQLLSIATEAQMQ